MSVDILTCKQQPRLAEIDAELSAMMQRIRGLLDRDALDQSDLIELAAIYNNLAYLFLYLESNAAHVDWAPVARWKQAFFSDTALSAALADRLSNVSFQEAESERARTAYLRFFEARSKGELDGSGERVALLKQAHDVLALMRSDQSRLLARLGAQAAGPPDAVFYNVISSAGSASTREKLARAWKRVRDAHAPALERIADGLTAVRHARSKSRGFDCALAETLQRCRLSEAQPEAFITEYLELAIESQDRLDQEVRSALGVTDAPMHHFEYYVRCVQGRQQVPLFPLESCLDFAFCVAKAVFDLEFVRARETSGNVVRVDAIQNGRLCGAINFDLWDHLHAPKSANTTFGARNRMEWGGRVQLPVAYVSCRFKRRDQDGDAITFQNVHSLFHEFGHAINHLLITRTIPSESGLEYLPVERLETLGMWFEKWVFHPSFAPAVKPRRDEEALVHVAQAIKRLEYRRTHVDRVVTAALDFEVSKDSTRSVREAFDALNRRFSISRHCALEDFLGYFTLPMLDANPGGYFGYLWGAAESARNFAPWRSADTRAWPGPAAAREIFAPCFDFDAPSHPAPARATFSFYEQEAGQCQCGP